MDERDTVVTDARHYALQLCDLQTELEQHATGGYNATVAFTGEHVTVPIEELLDDKAPADLDFKERAGLVNNAVHWAVETAETQMRAINRASQKSGTLVDWKDVAGTAAHKATAHVDSLTTNFDHLSGPAQTHHRIVTRSALVTGSALACELLPALATNSKKRMATPVNRYMQATGNLFEGLATLPFNPNHGRSTIQKEIVWLESTNLNRLYDNSRDRLQVFIDLLPQVADKVSGIVDANFRDYDIDWNAPAIARHTKEKLLEFMLAVRHEDIQKLLDNPEQKNLVISVLGQEIADEQKYSFSDAAASSLGAVNQGKRHYATTTATLERARRDAGIESPVGQPTKAAAFDLYTPELRKIAIMLGGHYNDIVQVYAAAGELLEACYVAAETDDNLPKFRDFYLTLASYFNIGPLKDRALSIQSLSAQEKQELSRQLDINLDYTAEAHRNIKANCFGTDPDLFFPSRGASTKPAKRICQDCCTEQRERCYMQGMGEKFGVWVELSERQRRRIRRDLNIPEPTEDEDVLTIIGSMASESTIDPLNDEQDEFEDDNVTELEFALHPLETLYEEDPEQIIA